MGPKISKNYNEFDGLKDPNNGLAGYMPINSNQFLTYQHNARFQLPQHPLGMNGMPQNKTSYYYQNTNSANTNRANPVVNNTRLNTNKNESKPLDNTGNNNINNSTNYGFDDLDPNSKTGNNTRNSETDQNVRSCSEIRRKTVYTKSAFPTKSTLLQELLECPICMNLYENPHVLPCQHTFCKKCIVSLQNVVQSTTTNNNNNSNRSIACPICRETHYLPNGIEGLSANYTMKRLIELESMANEKEKQKEIPPKETAKCFGCQKYDILAVCHDCSYMLCKDCIGNPDHILIIESKFTSRRNAYILSNFDSVPKPQSKYSQNLYNHPGSKHDIYTDEQRLSSNPKLKLILLCHSSAVDAVRNDASSKQQKIEIYEDEHGKCTTFTKISIMCNERLITLKKIVETKFGISCNDQILVYKDKALANDLKTLSYYNLHQYSQVHIFDERDIKENVNDSDDDSYGIYQDASLTHLDHKNEHKTVNLKKEKINKQQFNEDSIYSASQLQNQQPHQYQQHQIYQQNNQDQKVTLKQVPHHQQSPSKQQQQQQPQISRQNEKLYKVADIYYNPSLSQISNEMFHRSNNKLTLNNKVNKRSPKNSYEHEYEPRQQNYHTLNKKTVNSPYAKYSTYSSTTRLRKLDELFDQQFNING